ARQITSDVVKPFFKKGDYAGGIEAGVEAILRAARGEGYAGGGRTGAGGGGGARPEAGPLPRGGGRGPRFGARGAVLPGRLLSARRGEPGYGFGTAGRVLVALGAGAFLATVLCSEPVWLALAFPATVAGIILWLIGFGIAQSLRPGGASSRLRRSPADS